MKLPFFSFTPPDQDDFVSATRQRLIDRLKKEKARFPVPIVFYALDVTVLQLYFLEECREPRYKSSPKLDAKGLKVIEQAIDEYVYAFVKGLPPSATCSAYKPSDALEEPEQEDAPTLFLLDLYSEPPRDLVQKLIFAFYNKQIYDRDLFLENRLTLDENLERCKGIGPLDFKAPPREFVEAFLSNTNLFLPFTTPVPFAMPQETRFSGHWIIAPPGRGKTTLLHNLFLDDVKRNASIIVLDSKGDLINPIRNLKHIEDRLVIIEPHPDHPLALNPLDIPKTNVMHSIALMEYVFSSLLEAKMTALQSTLFRNLFPAIVECVPNPTLMDFRNIVEMGIGNYDFSKLPTLQSQFFERQFDSKTYTDTRNQLIWRLDFLLTNPLMRAMFEAPKTKIDISREMDAGKIILINNSKELLTDDGAEFFGRFFVALVLSAAQQRSSRKPEDKLPCYFYIDEAHNVIRRDTKIATILDECRSQNIALILAHQRTEQIKDTDVLSALSNCAIRYANSDDEAKLLADKLRTTPEALRALPRGSFAAYIRDLTPKAITIEVPASNIANLPQLTNEEVVALRERMREQFCFEPPRSQPPEAPKPAAPRTPASEASTDW